jgi:hypothetical protein
MLSVRNSGSSTGSNISKGTVSTWGYYTVTITPKSFICKTGYTQKTVTPTSR